MTDGTSAGALPSRVWKVGRFAPWLLVVLVLAIYLPGIAQLPLLDRDEPRFATAAREMMERDDWIVPTFNRASRMPNPSPPTDSRVRRDMVRAEFAGARTRIR